MNVSKSTNFLILVFVLLLPWVISAQQTTTDALFQGESSEFHLSSVLLPPSISKMPSNGTAIFEATGTTEGVEGANKLVYTPNANFTGKDTVEVYYWSDVATPATSTFIIDTKKSVVTAYDDHVSTKMGDPINVFVLANDMQTNGNLSIQDILVSNNDADITINFDGSITYTPPAGFKGTANLNYLVCNEINACDIATLSITVHEDVPTEELLQLVTTKNTAKSVLLALDGYALLTSPTKGFLDDSEDVLKYQPYPNETGKDMFAYQKDGVVKTVEVDILNVDEANQYAKDDYVYTAIGQPVEIAFLNNDNLTTYQDIRIIQQPYYGTLTLGASADEVTYQPYPGYFTTNNPFSIDRFVYQVLVDGVLETATVYIHVSDFAPSASAFDLYTTKNKPLAIQYAVPIKYSGFEIVTQGSLGTVSFHQNLDQEIYGQQVVGEQVLLYIPNENATGTDQFEIQYCVSEGNCKALTINVDIQNLEVETDCFGDDCVWAGDANNDGVVDMQDLLTVGLFVGHTGPARDNVNLDHWYGGYGAEWFANESIVTTVDIDLFSNHVDTNGDGVITAKDTSAISTFYGKHNAITPTPMPDTDALPIYYGKYDTIPVAGPGAILEIPIILGNEYYPAEEIYGLTFNINYAPDIFVPGTAEITFADDSWLAYASPTLDLAKEPFDGNIEVGFTRTDGNASSGYGQIATFSIVTTVDIDLFRLENQVVEPLSITATVTNGQGVSKQLGSDTYQLRLIGEEENKTPEQLDNAQRLVVFPNPTTDVLNLHLNGIADIERYEVYTMTGQLLKNIQNNTPLQVKDWNDGIYIVKVYTTDGGVLNKKFEVVK